jgi:hypothetical protein
MFFLLLHANCLGTDMKFEQYAPAAKESEFTATHTLALPNMHSL